MTEDRPLGKTGDFPQGKLNDADEGGLRFAVMRMPDGNVMIQFSTPVSWLALPPDGAAALAKLLLDSAGVDPRMLQDGGGTA